MSDNPFITFGILWGAFGIWRCVFILVDIRKYLKALATPTTPEAG